MKTTQTMSNTKSAFTLIELLVVIAIIAILAAILFPVFARARENARRASCQSNLKQAGLAFAQYSQDYDERNVSFPAAGFPTWDARMEPYLGIRVEATSGAQILQCPSDSTVRVFGSCNPATTAQPRSYSLSGNNVDRNTNPNPARATMAGTYTLIAGNFATATYVGRVLSEIEVPAQTLQLVEKVGNDNIFANNTGAVVASPEGGGQTAQNGSRCGVPVFNPIHLEGWNYLFADGHVKWYRPEQTIGTGSMTSPRGFWTLVDND